MQDLQGLHGSDRKWLFFYRERLTRVERILKNIKRPKDIKNKLMVIKHE